MSLIKPAFLSFVFVALAACSSPPFVYDANEFNREAADFGKPVTDIATVTVCYSSWEATPSQVAKMASQECAKFSKIARFTEQNYSSCPLMAPVAAIYQCYDPNEEKQKEYQLYPEGIPLYPGSGYSN